MGLLSVGWLRYYTFTAVVPENHIVHHSGTSAPLSISGIVSNYPDIRPDKILLTIEVDKLWQKEVAAASCGKILVTFRNVPGEFQYGQEIWVRGKLRKPRDCRNPGEFDYRDYLLAQKIHAVMTVSDSKNYRVLADGRGNWFWQSMVMPVKGYLDDLIIDNLDSSEQALLRGLMIGERGFIAMEMRDDFAKLGVIHILAVSGLHVGFVILIFMGVSGFFRIPYWLKVLLTILALAFYACLTDLKPPVVRASVMGSLVLIATLIERKTDIYNILALAALLILLFNPMQLFQAGFQLSFMAVISIISLYPKIRQLAALKKIGDLKFLKYPADLFAVSLAAFFGTLPFTLYYFNRVPSFALLANIFIIPLAFCGLASGIAAAVSNLLLPALAQQYMASAWLSLHVLIKSVSWGAALPYASWEVYSMNLHHMPLYFGTLFILANLNVRRFRRWSLIWLLLLVNIFVWRFVFKNDHLFEVVFLDIGQGDAALLRLPGDKNILIDGGPRNPYYDAGQWVIEPYLKRQGIDELYALVLSHTDADHLGGFPHILRKFKVQEVWDNGVGSDTRLFREYLHLVDSLKIKRRILHTGDFLEDFDPVKMFVMHPSTGFSKSGHHNLVNEASLSLKVSVGSVDLLFIGDVESAGEAELSRFGPWLQSEVLKVAHHGSITSSSQKLIDHVNPDIAVISVGEMNKFGHPSPEVLSRYERSDSEILRTDLESAVILHCDGTKIERITWK
jgi:competence protein ComEC